MEQARSEAATPRRLARARAHGDVAVSPVLTASASLLGLSCALVLVGGALRDGLLELLQVSLQAAREPVPDWGACAVALRALCRPLLMAVLAPALAAGLAGFLQVGPLFASLRVVPDPRRFEFAARLRALVAPHRLLESAWLLLALGALLGVCGYVYLAVARAVLAAPASGLQAGLFTAAVAAVQLCVRLGLAAALLGGIDLVYRRVLLARALRMTRRELDDEHKESHGAPENRARRARLFREAVAALELNALPHAQLLLLDMRGRAIALGFDADDSAQRAPRVIAKGQGALCERMRLHALHAGVPVAVDAELVVELHRLELTEEIPSLHYARVADHMRAQAVT